MDDIIHIDNDRPTAKDYIEMIVVLVVIGGIVIKVFF
jgi:hypothetical protein